MAQTTTQFRFAHQRLDVFRTAIEFVTFVENLESRWFRGNYTRKRQLTDAADSIALNIAEGTARGSSGARKNHNRIALGSAAECDAILQILEVKHCPVRNGRQLLARVGAMLSRMH